MLLARKLKPFYLCFGHHLDVYGTDILENLFNLMRGNIFLKILFLFHNRNETKKLSLLAINRMHIHLFIHFVQTVYH